MHHPIGTGNRTEFMLGCLGAMDGVNTDFQMVTNRW